MREGDKMRNNCSGITSNSAEMLVGTAKLFRDLIKGAGSEIKDLYKGAVGKILEKSSENINYSEHTQFLDVYLPENISSSLKKEIDFNAQILLDQERINGSKFKSKLVKIVINKLKLRLNELGKDNEEENKEENKEERSEILRSIDALSQETVF